MFPKESGIYCFENILDGKKYVGQSQNINKRIIDHKSYLGKGRDSSKYLQHAWTLYGENSFIIYIIELCSVEKLDSKETCWIAELHSLYSDKGYNISLGGKGTMRGRKHTEDSKKKMSKASLGKPKSEETKRRMSEFQKSSNNRNIGRHHSEEVKRKSSESRMGEKNSFYGKTHTKETNSINSQSKLGIKKNKNSTCKALKKSTYINYSSKYTKISFKIYKNYCKYFKYYYNYYIKIIIMEGIYEKQKK